MNKWRTRVVITALFGRLILCIAYAEELPVLKTAYSEGLFSGMNLTAVQASTRFWVDSFGIPKDICKAGSVQFYDDASAWRNAAEYKSFTLGIISVTDFLVLEEEHFIEPCFVFKDTSGIGAELLLLTRRNEETASLSDLEGQELLLTTGPLDTIARWWVDSLLTAEQCESSKAFFGAIREEDKANDAILSLLCSRTGACVVSRAGFETMKELNPKLGENLVVLARSPNFVSTVICMLRDCDPELGAGVRAALGRMHEDVVGRQILMSLRINGFQPYTPECIQPVRSLVNARDAYDKPIVPEQEHTTELQGEI